MVKREEAITINLKAKILFRFLSVRKNWSNVDHSLKQNGVSKLLKTGEYLQLKSCHFL